MNPPPPVVQRQVYLDTSIAGVNMSRDGEAFCRYTVKESNATDGDVGIAPTANETVETG
jgi:hypothetical protein